MLTMQKDYYKLKMNCETSREIEKRVVFDIGSGGTKTSLIEFDVVSQQIVRHINAIAKPFPYQGCIDKSKHSILEEECQEEAISVLRSIIEEYDVDCMQIKCAGIATAWARNARNTDLYLERLKHEYNFYIKTVSQHKEGEIGYKAAIQYITAHHYHEHNVLIWDIGGGSFQLNTEYNNQFYVYNGLYGASNFEYELKSHFGYHSELLNASQVVQAREWAANNVKISQISYEIALRQDFYAVYGIGQFMNKGIQALLPASQNFIDSDQISDLIAYFGQNTPKELDACFPTLGEQFIAPMQTNLLLVEAIMNAANITVIEFLDGAKATDAIALEADFWI